MKYPLLLTVLFFCLASSGSFTQDYNVKNYCNYQESRDSAKLALRPYRYTSQKKVNLELKNHKQFKELVVPIFQDSKYKFVFNAEGMPGKLTIRVYHEPVDKDDREKLFEKTTEGGQFTYETEKSKEYEQIYVDYIIPAKQTDDLDKTERACVIMLSGYQVKFTGDPEKDESGDGGFLSNLFSGDGGEDGGEEEAE